MLTEDNTQLEDPFSSTLEPSSQLLVAESGKKQEVSPAIKYGIPPLRIKTDLDDGGEQVISKYQEEESKTEEPFRVDRVPV